MVMTKFEALKILELDQGSSPEDVRSSYKKLALKWHPDKHNNSEESTRKFQEISEAYKRLTSKEDDDDVRISMADMFDLFAHIFFSTSGYFVNDQLFYSDDDDDDDDNEQYMYLNPSDSSDDEVPIYRSRQHHAKYSDLMASRVSRAAANAYRNEMRKKKTKVNAGISEEQARKNADELIKEEEKLKKKAEKRRARKKRNRANRKQREKEQKADEQEDEKPEASEEKETHSRERRDSSKENKNPTNNENNTKANSHKNKKSGEEEDSENEHAHDEVWDTSSAFFNHAARRGPVHTTSQNTTHETTSADTPVNRHEHNTQTNQEDRQRTEQLEKDHVIEQSRQLAAIGNNEANEGNYGTAIEYFTQAISLHNRDFRFFGNRSYCYDRLGEFSKALQDAEVTIMLVPHWAKGYFRKGRALAGLKQYSDAEKAFLQVLKLDKHCEDAKFELTRVRVQQLKDMGFGHGQSERAVRLYGTVHASLDALLAGKVKNLVANEEEMYVSDGETEEEDNDPRQKNTEPLASLWVGNIDSKQVTERQLTHLFSKFGNITLIRILPQSFCAFVNYENKDSAARAMQSLQGYLIGGQNIIIRYQGGDKNTKTADKNSKATGPVNGNECYFWRTTGCAYGDKCHYTHIPSNKGVDINKVEQKYGKLKAGKKGR